jgi:hypothetical protein
MMGILQYILDRAGVPGIVFGVHLELMDCRLTKNHVSLDGLDSDEMVWFGLVIGW